MATATTVKLIAPYPFWNGGTFSGTQYVAASDGTIVANSADAANLINAGCQYLEQYHRFWTTPGSPSAASATAIVSSLTLTAGTTTTLTIAHQPDVPRQLQALCYGTMPVSSGALLTLTYLANDGTPAQVDALTIAGTTNPVTVTTSKGVSVLTSAIVTGVSGGTTPGIEIGTNGYLAVPVDQGFVDLTFTKEVKLTPTLLTGTTLSIMVPADESIGTLGGNGLIQPTVAPNASCGYSWGYLVAAPANVPGTTILPYATFNGL